MPQSSIAVAADFAEAMLTARRAKNWLVAMILVMILLQITLFFLVRLEVVNIGAPRAAPASAAPVVITTPPETQPEGDVGAATDPVVRAASNTRATTRQRMLQYVVGLTT